VEFGYNKNSDIRLYIRAESKKSPTRVRWRVANWQSDSEDEWTDVVAGLSGCSGRLLGDELSSLRYFTLSYASLIHDVDWLPTQRTRRTTVIPLQGRGNKFGSDENSNPWRQKPLCVKTSIRRSLF